MGSKGGVATVVNALINGDAKTRGYKMKHLVTHKEGSVIKRVFFFLHSVCSLIIQRNVDLAHIHVCCDGSFYRKSLLAFINRIKGIPVIMHVHGCDFDRFYNNSPKFAQKIIKGTFKKSKKVLVLSSSWNDFFRDYILENNSGNLEILQNGVTVDLIESSLVSKVALQNFLFLGRLCQRKGVYDLLESINILVNQQNRKNLVFYLAGDGEIFEVEKIIEKYHLQKNVIILGWIDEVQRKQHFNNCCTVLLPSYSEGLPMALLEAMAHGKVIISTNVGGIPELVNEGENGFLIEPGGISTLAERIVHVHDHPHEMEQISINNRKKIHKDYNLETLNERLYAIYSASALN